VENAIERFLGEEHVVTTSTKLTQFAGLFPKRNIDSYISLAPRQMI
jgi:hypothetical protein